MMSKLPQVYLARHGETAWVKGGRHTGRTDIPLTERGERNAQRLGKLLAGLQFARVWSSPSQRALRTCQLAGFGVEARVDPELAEWDYGDYEGWTTPEIHQREPTWTVFTHGCPGGESVADAGRRADRVIGRLRAVNDDILIFSSAHFLRALTARWLGLDAANGKYFLLSTATLSILSYEHTTNEPVIRLWNDDRHVGD